MRGEREVIDSLNAVLKNELTAINQYFLHSRMLKDWGFHKLSQKIYDESLGEMKHADQLVERVLMLDSLPNLQELGKLKIGENVEEIFKCDLSLEVLNQSCVKKGIVLCENKHDFVSREILQGILADTEEHIDWIEEQQSRINQAGVQNYLQEQMEETLAG